jgi:putative hemolysin
MRRRDEKRLMKRLESERPQPSDELLSTLAARMGSTGARRRSGWQLAAVAGFTMLLASALALTGGIGYAASAVKGGTTAVTTLVTGPSDADKPKKTAAQSTSASQSGASTSSNANSAARGNQQSAARNQYQEKVLICHIPPGEPDNAHTISVSPNAVPAHLAHGDTLGPCPNGN